MESYNLENYNPQADIRKYYQYWFEGIPANCSAGFVGIIKNFSNEKLKIRIEIDDKWMDESHQRNCALCVEPDDFWGGSIIVITKEYFDAVINGSEKISFLWHEIGHFHTMRYFPEYFGNNQSRLRREAINRGQVYPAETVADLIAAYYSGKDVEYEALSQSTRERHRLSQMGDTNASTAWWELRRRKRAIQNMQSDEEIEAEICRLCNVKSFDEL